MTIIKYPKFTVKTDIKLPIRSLEDIDSYIRIVISPRNALLIYEGELSLVTARGILSGDEELCLTALNDILEDRKYKVSSLESLVQTIEHITK